MGSIISLITLMEILSTILIQRGCGNTKDIVVTFLGGEILGGAALRCRVWTECRADNARLIGEVVVPLIGFTLGVKGGLTYFNIELDDHITWGRPDLKRLVGWSHAYTAGGALIAGKSIFTDLKIGSTSSTGFNETQYGLGASADLFWGRSYFDWMRSEKCCQ